MVQKTGLLRENSGSCGTCWDIVSLVSHATREGVAARMRRAVLPQPVSPRPERACPGFCRPAFTLVELLVVIGVIAVLIAVLLPALRGARQNAQLVCSMSNMRQINAGALAYTYDNEENWPVIPIKEPAPGVEGDVYFDSWQYAGKTTSDFWKTYFGGLTYHTIEERPLNPYVYPDLDLVDPADGIRELEVYRCPGDTRTYQRGYWQGRGLDMSCYDDVGTSYHLNVNWWYASISRSEENSVTWRRLRPMFRKGGLVGPSRFVWMYDQIMDVVAIYGKATDGVHGGLNRAKASYMDGHVTYLTVEPKVSNTTEYSLLLE